MNNDIYVKTIYNDELRPQTQYPSRLINYLVDRFSIPNNASILDSGCGRGDFAKAFADKGMSVIGVDGAISVFDDKIRGIGGIDLENDALPFEDGSFDVVFSKSVLEHIHRPEKYLSEIKRVLKKDGCIILLVPDWHSQMYIYYDDFSHVQPYTVKGVKDALDVFGFKKTDAEIFYQLPCVWRWGFIKFFCRLLQFFGGPVKKVSKNKFYRFSRELMILAVGYK